MSRKIAKITAFLTAGTILMSMTACNSSIDNSQYSLSKIALSDTENAWSNPEAKYAELLKTYGSNSCAGALAVATDKDLVYLYCEDDVEKDGTTPVSQNTVFDIASMSKVFTAVSILQLAEKGKLSIDDTLDKYFPAYETGKNITIYNLLHMNSGISDYLNNPDPFWDISGADAANKQLSEIICKKDRATKFPLDDMIADVDAKNMYYMYGENDTLSAIMENYYKSNYTKRFNMFVDCYGGIDKLERGARYFCFDEHHAVDHRLLGEFAEQATKEFKLYAIFNETNVVNEYGHTVYELPAPDTITNEESEALVYAFISFIQSKVGKENE